MLQIRRYFYLFVALLAALLPLSASAHETYVLSREEVKNGMADTTVDLFSAVKNPQNLWLLIEISIAVLVVLIAFFYLQNSQVGRQVDKKLRNWSDLGLLFVRITLALALFYSALSGSIFGPELALDNLLFAPFLPSILFGISFLLFVGLFTEVAAFIGLLLFSFAAITYHWYIFLYLHYAGVFVTLILFGSRVLSIDSLLFGPLERFKDWKNFEQTILRITYGFALAFAAFYVKLLHPALTLTVINRYHLTQFGFLFPSDPVLAVFCAFLAEFSLGLFILLGFETRLMALVTLALYTLSLLFFQEAVWPHFLLYGLSISLLFSNGGRSGIDLILAKKFRRSAKKSADTEI